MRRAHEMHDSVARLHRSGYRLRVERIADHYGYTRRDAVGGRPSGKRAHTVTAGEQLGNKSLADVTSAASNQNIKWLGHNFLIRFRQVETSDFNERPTTFHLAKVDIAKLVRVTVEIFSDLGIDGHELELAMMHLRDQRLDIVPSG